MIRKDIQEQKIETGSRWFAFNSGGKVNAQIVNVEPKNDIHQERVYFTVEHRPGEVLDCYSEAFLSRYTQSPSE